MRKMQTNLGKASEKQAEMTNKTQETMKEGNKFKPCGGCGATHPRERCINCFHDFGDGKPTHDFLGNSLTASPSPKQTEAQPQQEGEVDITVPLKVNKSTDYQCVTPDNWQSLQSQLSTLTAENAKLKERNNMLASDFLAKALPEEITDANRKIASLLISCSNFKSENAKLWKALEEVVKDKFDRSFAWHREYDQQQLETMLEQEWQQFKSNLLAK